GRSPEHFLGLGADGFDPAVDLVEGHNRRLAENDALAASEDAGVGGAEINRQVVREAGEERGKHAPPWATCMPSLTLRNPPEPLENTMNSANSPHAALRIWPQITNLKLTAVRAARERTGDGQSATRTNWLRSSTRS